MESWGKVRNCAWGAQGEEADSLSSFGSIRLVRRFTIGGGISFWRQEKKGLINGALDDNIYRAEIERLQKIIGKQAIQIEILKKTEDLFGRR